MKSLVILFASLASVPVLHAGQSLVLSGSQTASNASVPAQGANSPCRVEFQVTAPSATPAAGYLVPQPNACGILVYSVGAGTGALEIYNNNVTGNCPGFTPACVNINFSNFTSNWMLVRFQMVPSGAGGTMRLEAWDINGVLQQSTEYTYTGTSGTNSNGISVGATAAENWSWGFFRLFTTTVAMGGIPPLFSDTGGLLEWRFNNSLLDNGTSGGNYTATSSAGAPANPCGVAPCYQASTGQTLVKPVIYSNLVANMPSWASKYPTVGVKPWDISGTRTNYLDGSATYTQADTNTPSCTWSKLTGPALTITSPTSLVTTVTPVAGTPPFPSSYRIQLDCGGGNTVFQDIGALNIDPNGVVVQSDARVTQIFGPMIAMGYNPWGFRDERATAGATLQIANNTFYSSMVAGGWGVSGTGTVSYPFGGIGSTVGPAGATTCGTTSCNGTTLSASGLTVSIHNAQNLPSLAHLPSWFWFGNPPSAGETGEMFRVTATTATTGDATLTIGYDGRGLALYAFGQDPAAATAAPAASWPSGTNVGEMRLSGTSTLFATDTNRPLCPAGLPGPPGPVVYSTGTVQLAASSTAVTGIGTNWTTANKVTASYSIRVQATHGGGTPFIWWAQIVTVGGTTSITASRPAPADVDTATNFNYAITAGYYLSLEWNNADGTYRLIQNMIGCESETAAFLTPAHDLPSVDSTVMTGLHYSWKTGLGAVNAFGPNFYGTGLAQWAYYFSSGYGPALTAAEQIDDNWLRDPEACSGWCGAAQNYNYSGSFIGAVVDVLFNPAPAMTWADIRPLANNAVAFFTTAHSVCNTGPTIGTSYDIRDQAIFHIWLTEAALFDPDATHKAAWLAAEGSAGGGAGTLGRDSICKRADNSFSLGTVGNIVIALTNGSTAGTLVSGATDLHHVGASGNSACAGSASGTITVTHGSALATLVTGSLGSNPHTPLLTTDNYNIAITDTTSSPNYIGFLEFRFSGSAVTLAGAWPGASGTFNFVVQDNEQGLGNSGTLAGLGGGITTIALDGSDADNVRMQEAWACTIVDNTHITLNRPWDDGVTGGTNHASGNYLLYPSADYGVGVGGYYNSPFQYGIRTYPMHQLANYSSDTTVANGYKAMLSGMGQWFANVGYDTNTKGAYYARVSLACEPFITANASTLFTSIHGASGYLSCGNSGLGAQNGDGTGEQNERVDTAEAFHAVVENYIQQCAIGPSQCDAARALGDQAYGAIWGNCSMTAGGGSSYYCDGNYVTQEDSDASLGAFRWDGFFFGMGMSHQWPAVRTMYQTATAPRSSPPPKTLGIPRSLMAWVKRQLALSHQGQIVLQAFR